MSLARLLAPFDIAADSTPDESLIMGHVIEALAEEFLELETIDCMDVATAAYELGHDPAGHFLDQAPMMIVQYLRGIADLRTTNG